MMILLQVLSTITLIVYPYLFAGTVQNYATTVDI